MVRLPPVSGPHVAGRLNSGVSTYGQHSAYGAGTSSNFAFSDSCHGCAVQRCSVWRVSFSARNCLSSKLFMELCAGCHSGSAAPGVMVQALGHGRLSVSRRNVRVFLLAACGVGRTPQLAGKFTRRVRHAPSRSFKANPRGTCRCYDSNGTEALNISMTQVRSKWAE